jgi:choline dehydrogenase-like flavoprotein
VSVFLPNNFLEIQSAVILRYNLTLKAFNFNFFNLSIQLLNDIKKIYLSTFEVLKNIILRRKKFYIVARIEQVPNKNSRVYLSKIKNEYENFLPILDWQMKTQDLKALLINFNEIKLNLEKKDIANIYPLEFIEKMQNQKFDKTKDEWDKNLKKEVFGVGHHMGTTRMGEDKNISVVNSNLKVHEIDNLYCAGSSVFPTCGYINPTLTIVALSLRLAEHLESKI